MKTFKMLIIYTKKQEQPQQVGPDRPLQGLLMCVGDGEDRGQAGMRLRAVPVLRQEGQYRGPVPHGGNSDPGTFQVGIYQMAGLLPPCFSASSSGKWRSVPLFQLIYS